MPKVKTRVVAACFRRSPMTASGFDTCPSVRMKSCREISGWAAGARTACRGRQDVGPAEIGVQGGDGLVPVDLRFLSQA